MAGVAVDPITLLLLHKSESIVTISLCLPLEVAESVAASAFVYIHVNMQCFSRTTRIVPGHFKIIVLLDVILL